MTGYEPVGQGFESLAARQINKMSRGASCLFLCDARDSLGVPEKYCAANFLGKGQTNEATLKGFARKFFLLRSSFGRCSAPRKNTIFDTFKNGVLSMKFALRACEIAPLWNIAFAIWNICCANMGKFYFILWWSHNISCRRRRYFITATGSYFICPRTHWKIGLPSGKLGKKHSAEKLCGELFFKIFFGNH